MALDALIYLTDETFPKRFPDFPVLRIITIGGGRLLRSYASADGVQ